MSLAVLRVDQPYLGVWRAVILTDDGVIYERIGSRSKQDALDKARTFMRDNLQGRPVAMGVHFGEAIPS